MISAHADRVGKSRTNLSRVRYHPAVDRYKRRKARIAARGGYGSRLMPRVDAKRAAAERQGPCVKNSSTRTQPACSTIVRTLAAMRQSPQDESKGPAATLSGHEPYALGHKPRRDPQPRRDLMRPVATARPVSPET
jgi:hypothetical protein